MEQRPFFYKIFNELTEKKLKIPLQFVKDFLKEVPKRTVLEGPSGGPWCVKVIKTAEGDVFLGDGWQKFVEDNLLHVYNFLLFGYDRGARCFTVQIFEQSGLERDYTSAPTTHQDVANSSGIKNLDPHSRRSGQSTKDSAVIQEKAKSFCSQHPFFELLIKRYNVGPPFLMFIPKWFAEEHFQMAKTKIRLKNSEGKAWEVNCTVNSGSLVFVGGLSRFVRDNELKVGNVCIFELVAEKVLQVHIF
ncbi:hypothetical protein ACH5RR_022138 [Cinchona calisaya]|uniref:TF-B3 domain-containing protein n=1 Tax=Cinchona calisaya TaxID=153742 RepID=A0ABD2Z6Y2_9GENT